jgi:hypothetical protein
VKQRQLFYGIFIGCKVTLSALARVLVPAFLLVGNCRTAIAQGTSSPNTATITGVAVDSVRGGYLTGATIALSSTDRIAITDSVGRFRFDSVARGTYSLRLAHPLLDTLAIAISTRPFELEPDEAKAFVLAVPSASTVVGRKCSADDQKLGGSVLTGMVLDADTKMPGTHTRPVCTKNRLRANRHDGNCQSNPWPGNNCSAEKYRSYSRDREDRCTPRPWASTCWVY